MMYLKASCLNSFPADRVQIVHVHLPASRPAVKGGHSDRPGAGDGGTRCEAGEGHGAEPRVWG